MPIRSFKSPSLLLFLSLSAFAVRAEQDDLFQNLLEQQQAIVEHHSFLPAWLKPIPAPLPPDLVKYLAPNTSAVDKAAGVDKPLSIKGRWIFVSFAMPIQELKAAAYEAAETASVLVFRGVAKNENMREFTKRLQVLLQGITPTPGVIIDPLLFKHLAITTVPTMLMVSDQGQLKRVRGLPGFNWLQHQLSSELGQKGPVYSIEEPDMMAEIQRRLVAIDWTQQQRNALATFWDKQDADVALPTATRHRERLLDPSLIITQNIYHPDGRLIAEQGQRINPQTLLPMRNVYIVFDATQPSQIEAVKTLGAQLAKTKLVIYLFSRLDAKDGWRAYRRLMAELAAPVYQLNQALLKRFQLQALPTVIEGRGERLAVTEISPKN